MRLIESQEEDTTSSAVPWTIDVEELAVNASKLKLSMNGDSLQASVDLDKVTATQGHFDLERGIYSLGTFDGKGAVTSDAWSSPVALKTTGLRYEGCRLTITDVSLKAASSVVSGHVDIDMNAFTVKLDGQSVPCTPKETEILWTLASNPGMVFSREHMLQSIWGYDFLGDTRAVDSHIKRIRAKLCADDNGWDIKTVWGIGYRFEANEGK